MKKRLSLLIFVFALSGCVITPTDMRNEKPYASFTSKKDPVSLSKCIASDMESHSYWGVSPQINVREIEGGVTLASQSNVELIDILKSRDMTVINFYSAFTHTWIGPNQGRIDNVVNGINKCIN